MSDDVQPRGHTFAASVPSPEAPRGFWGRLAYRTETQFEWRIPRQTTFPQNAWLLTKASIGLAVLLLIAVVGILGGVVLYYELPPDDALKLLAMTAGMTLLVVGVLWLVGNMDALFHLLLGNKVDINRMLIELSVGTKSIRYPWKEIENPRVIGAEHCAEHAQAGSERPSLETGRLEFNHRLANGTLQEQVLRIYGDVDLAALQKFADEHCATS